MAIKKNKIQTINFRENSYDILTNAVKATDSNYSALVSKLICDVLGADETVRRDLSLYAYQQSLKRANEASESSAFQRAALARQSEQYMALFDLFRVGQDWVQPEANNMQRIDLKDSYLICPEEWIYLDVSNPSAATDAVVIEFYNGDKFNLPHFVFAVEGEITRGIEKAALELAAQASQEFLEVYKKYQTPLFSGEGIQLNAKEVNEQPVPGFFKIAKLGTADSYPYGAMIITKEENHG